MLYTTIYVDYLPYTVSPQNLAKPYGRAAKAVHEFPHCDFLC